jgi:hypothetical protein
MAPCIEIHKCILHNVAPNFEAFTFHKKVPKNAPKCKNILSARLKQFLKNLKLQALLHIPLPLE